MLYERLEKSRWAARHDGKRLGGAGGDDNAGSYCGNDSYHQKHADPTIESAAQFSVSGALSASRIVGRLFILLILLLLRQRVAERVHDPGLLREQQDKDK